MGLRAKITAVAALALAAGLIGYGLLGPSGSGKVRRLQQELEKLQEENRQLQDDIKRLGLEVEGLLNRQDYQEQVIRDDLGLVRPDEVLIQLQPAPDGGMPKEVP